MKKIWIFCDEGKVGSLSQARALANAIGLPYDVYDIKSSVFSILLPYLKVNPNPKIIKPPYPDIVIGIGQHSVAATAYMSKFCKTIFIQNPHVSMDKFSAIILPKHDQLQGDNIITIHGALNGVSPSYVETLSKNRFKSDKKIAAVFIGGPSKHLDFTDKNINMIIERLLLLKEQGFDLLVTPSRRTKESHVTYLKEKLKDHTLYFWDLKEDNPYWDYIACADVFFVTTDSISMMTEMCSSGKPTYLFDVGVNKKKFKNFINYLTDNEYAFPVSNDIPNKQTKTLCQMQDCIKQLHKMDIL